jgi:hypothetical protein
MSRFAFPSARHRNASWAGGATSSLHSDSRPPLSPECSSGVAGARNDAPLPRHSERSLGRQANSAITLEVHIRSCGGYMSDTGASAEFAHGRIVGETAAFRGDPQMSREDIVSSAAADTSPVRLLLRVSQLGKFRFNGEAVIKLGMLGDPTAGAFEIMLEIFTSGRLAPLRRNRLEFLAARGSWDRATP